MKVKVDIFSGFLGAGKTRLIKKLINDKYYREKIAIVENEFGEVSIDGAILRETNTVITEINSGCICCQVSGNFKKAISNIISNYEIDRLIIEPTGVAKLSELKRVFEEKELNEIVEVDKLITVVDGERFYIYLNNFRKFFVDQIKAADVIVISRSQYLDKEKLEKIVTDINGLNKKAIVVDKEWSKVRAQELIPKGEYNQKEYNKVFRRAYVKSNKGVSAYNDSAEDTFQTFAMSISRSISKKELISKFNFVANTNSFGEIIRAKGIVKLNDETMNQFDFSLDEFSIETVSYEGEGIISFIGVDLNKDEITKFFQ
ncbi:GTP-binding protein [Clostridium sp. NSJ-6]|uniref:GTP-binding protein n=1 Tax=Clostridium hominis TaxID=2763036 RepID=A0ABR7D9H1_9CLOT|nr:GTP-binding protein [Clostridium hominis]MBC5627543.1 GTP-binding protein [Clostridium hominis]MDU2672602.1 GTP-binding protein [Clostridium sp.]